MHYVNLEPNIRMISSSPTDSGRAYHVIRSSRDNMQCPMEFHISKARKSKDQHPIKSTMRYRVDLHPKVIMQAIPRDVLGTMISHTRGTAL